MVAFAPAVRADVAGYDGARPPAAELARGPLQTIAEEVRRRTGALFVVISDDEGIRLSHPDAGELGAPVSTDPSAALAGAEEVTRETGTLGPSVRAKVPDPHGREGAATQLRQGQP